MAGRPLDGVRPADEGDLAAVQHIGEVAGRRFAEHPDPRVAQCADDPPIPLGELRAALAEGLLWVAFEPGDAAERPVGFLMAQLVARGLHVEELAVAPDHEGRGHGARLLETAAARSAALGRPELTLTTFGEVAWNRPYYERRGLRVLADDELDDDLRRIRAEDAARGLDPAIRVVMARPAEPGTGPGASGDPGPDSVGPGSAS